MIMNDYLNPHRRRAWALLCVLAFIAVACGSDAPRNRDGAVAAGDAEQAAPAPTVEATTETAVGDAPPQRTGAPVVEETAPEGPIAPAVESLYQADPAASSWPIAAGQWISHSFDPPLAFTLPVDGTVVADGADALEIAIGDQDNPDGFISVSTPIAVNRPTGPIPIDLVDEENALQGAELSYKQAGKGIREQYLVRDILLPGDGAFEDFVQPCKRLGPRSCLDPLVTGSGYVLLETDVVHSFVTQDWAEEDRLYVIGTSADPDRLVEFRDLAATIAASAIPAPSSTHDGVSWLSMLTRRAKEIPAGHYLARVGYTDFTLETETTLEAVEMPIIAHDVLGFEDRGLDGNDPVGWMWLIHFRDFLDDDGQRVRSDRTADGALPLDVFEADLRKLVDVGDTGIGVIAGVEVPWFSVTALPDTGLPCGATGWPTRTAPCLIWTRTSKHRWYIPGNVQTRLYYLQDHSLVLSATPFPGHTAEDLFARFQPLLDSLTIRGGIES